MDIRPLTNEHEAVAAFLDLTQERLRERARPTWVAQEGSRVIAAAETLLRPDDRLFVRFAGDPAATGPLARHIAVATEHRIHASAPADTSLVGQLVTAGFDIENTIEHFTVPFDSALSAVSRAHLPARYRLIDVSGADHDRLFNLDNQVRQLVPGTDGWHGNRVWFEDELTDPAAYAVAVEAATGDYVGLARMWRNPDGPRFGLIGVLENHRRPSPAPALLGQVLSQAAEWGYPGFTTETALTNGVVHPRLSRIGTPTGRAHQLVLRPDA